MPDPALRLPRSRPQRRFQNLRTITALILREMASTYGRSPGGYVWAVLEPLGMILILSFAFSLLLRSPSLGTHFILFYATGYLPFRMFREVQAAIAGALRYSRGLLVYPAVSYLDALIARFLLATLTQLMVACLILAGAILLLDVRLVLDIPPILAAFAGAAALGFGAGALNCLLFEMYPVWKSVWNIVTRPLLIVSAVIYIFEDLPRAAQAILWFNPLAHLTGLARSGFYSYYEPAYVSLSYVAALALTATVFGLLLLRRYYRRLMVL
ncbi:ABC transporter permease [Pseudoruegeria sp. HB172150]|uniref:ABC transporter permease n=1 Tax=Pseudoruegeria sp. HB172150 TaxID=2721164 RepID=UPI001552C3C2|nr:ABC transporter permease [Pseudoruegeria sp. HB172150]